MGFATGFLGIGIGLIINPLLLEYGLIPVVASATTMYIVTYISLAATISTAVNGQLNYEYGAMVAIMSVVGTVPGIILNRYMLKKTGR